MKLRKWHYFAASFVTSAILAMGYILIDGTNDALLLCAFPLLFVAATYPVVTLLNQIYLLLFASKKLPRLNLSQGIPDTLKTAVAMPCMLYNRQTVDVLIRDIKLQYFRNQEENLYFCLLSDFPDANEPVEQEDQELLQYAEAQVRFLNQECGNRFLLLHRPRRFNAADGIWMGYERKRGKLLDFTTYLVEGEAGTFMSIAGDTANLLGVRYVIVLDADTGLLEGSARALIAIVAHPDTRSRPVPRLTNLDLTES